MLFFVLGAAGSGKSSLVPLLRENLPHIAVYDFDHHPIIAGTGLTTTEQRQQVTEAWIQTALEMQPQDTIVCGLSVMGEVLACPSAPQLNHIAFCLLDCSDVQRLDRIAERGDIENASMAMLCWAAWLRVHHVDPTFRPDVINTGKNPTMQWDRWSHWERGHPDWRCGYIDSTNLTLSEVAEQVVQWINSEQGIYQSGYRLSLM